MTAPSWARVRRVASRPPARVTASQAAVSSSRTSRAIAFASVPLSAFSHIGRRTLLFLVLSGLGTCLSWLCYFRALQLGQASRVAPLDKLSVVFVLIFAAVFLGERVTAATVAGALLIAAGAVILAESHLAVHTWPELNDVTLDLYVCNFGRDNSAAARTACAQLIAVFAPLHIEKRELLRGTSTDGVTE